MDVIKQFVSHPRKFHVDHEDISSKTIKNYMGEMNLWVPFNWKNSPKIFLAFMVYVSSFVILISGYPGFGDIPDFGKFVNIFAGVQMSFVKWLFIYGRREKLLLLIDALNEKGQEQKRRAKEDTNLKRMRNRFYGQEMIVFLLTNCVSVVFVVSMFGQVLFYHPLELVVPCGPPLYHGGTSTNYWCNYFFQLCLTAFTSLCIAASDLMVGNLYSQLIWHLEVLNYDLRALNQREIVSSDEMKSRFRDFTVEFLKIRRLTGVCEDCMAPLFNNNILATVMAVSFCCVEMGIMVNVNWKECLKPAVYFIFLNVPFFYWCWLGNRLKEKSSDLALSAYIYKETASNVSTMKQQLNFIHMVQKPLIIKARPFFELDFEMFLSVLKLSYQFTTVFKNYYANK